MGSFSSETRDGTEQNVPVGTEVVSLLLAAAGEATTLLLPEESDERWEKKRKRERVVWSLVSDLRENTKADMASMEESLNMAVITKFHRLEDLVENVGLQRWVSGSE